MKKFIYVLKNVKHQLWLFILYLEGQKDRYRILYDFPQFNNLNLSNLKIELRESYSNYTTNVSSPQMATSIETATFLYNICSLLKPKYILDLGSGYSTYVFARYAFESGTKILLWSIDDNSKWLKKTNTFLKQQKYKSVQLIMWNYFKKIYSCFTI